MNATNATNLAITPPSTWQQRMEISGTLALITTVALVVLATTVPHLGIVGYSLFAVCDTLFIVATVTSYYYKRKAAQELQNAIVAHEQRPVIPATIQASDSFRITERLRVAIRPFFPFIKETLKAALRDHYREDNRLFPAIDQGINTLADETDRILENPREVFRLIVYFQALQQSNRETVKNLLAAHPTSQDFYQRLHTTFDGSLSRLIEEATRNRRLDEELNRKINRMRTLSAEFEQYHFDRINFDANSIPRQLLFVHQLISYRTKRSEYEQALSEIVLDLLTDRWEELFEDRFQSLGSIESSEAITVFFNRLAPHLNHFHTQENAEQQINMLYNVIATAQNRGDIDRALGRLGIAIFPNEELFNIVEWVRDLIEGLSNYGSEADNPPLIFHILRYLEGAYQPEGVLNSPAIRGVYRLYQRFHDYGPVEGIIKRLTESLINNYIDALPITSNASKENIKNALIAMAPDLLEPFFHATVDQDHPFRARIQNFITQSNRYIHGMAHIPLP